MYMVIVCIIKVYYIVKDKKNIKEGVFYFGSKYNDVN